MIVTNDELINCRFDLAFYYYGHFITMGILLLWAFYYIILLKRSLIVAIIFPTVACEFQISVTMYIRIWQFYMMSVAHKLCRSKLYSNNIPSGIYS